jgi:hypothetical protein
MEEPPHFGAHALGHTERHNEDTLKADFGFVFLAAERAIPATRVFFELRPKNEH